MAYDSYESGMKVAGLLLPGLSSPFLFLKGKKLVEFRGFIVFCFFVYLGQQNVTTVIDLPPQC